MGQCLSLVAKRDDIEEQEEQPDGTTNRPRDHSAEMMMEAMVAAAVPDCPPLDAPPASPVTMQDDQVELIEENRQHLVEITTEINLERVVDKLSHCIPSDKVSFFKDDKIKLNTRLHDFYTYIQSLPDETPFVTVLEAFYLVECMAVIRVLKHKLPKLEPASPRLKLEFNFPDANGNGDSNLNLAANPDAGDLPGNNGNGEQQEVEVEASFLQLNEINQIRSNLVELTERTTHKDLKDVIKILRDCIPSEKISLFLDEETDLLSRIRAFFNHFLDAGSPSQYSELVNAFQTANNQHVYNILKRSVPKPTPKRTKGTIPLQFPRDAVHEKVMTLPSVGGDDLDDFLVNLVDERELNSEQRMRILPAMKRMDRELNGTNTDKHTQLAYKCGTNPKGKVLILNIRNYEASKDPEKERKGSEHDVNDMEALFNLLGFKPEIYPVDKNAVVTGEDFKKQIRSFAKSLEHLHVDTCFVVIMCHGEELQTSGRGNAIIASDLDPVPLTWIKEQFSAKECPALIGKPKVFFYQICRGSVIGGVTENHLMPQTSYGQIDGQGKMVENAKPPTPPPTRAAPLRYERVVDDMLVCYATALGHVAHRDNENGSYFIQAIVDVFSKHAHDMHVRKMMDEVDKMLKQKCLTNKLPGSQTASIESIGFTKKLYINPDLYSDDEDEGAVGYSDPLTN